MPSGEYGDEAPGDCDKACGVLIGVALCLFMAFWWPVPSVNELNRSVKFMTAHETMANVITMGSVTNLDAEWTAPLIMDITMQQSRCDNNENNLFEVIWRGTRLSYKTNIAAPLLKMRKLAGQYLCKN